MFDHNVTRGALKNLVTDKPAPITNTNLINKPLGLAQGKAKGDDGAILSSMFDHNVTRGALKNLVTDKPAPITNTNLINKPIGLAQAKGKAKSDDGAILSSMFDHNVTRGALKNLVTDKPAPITNTNLINKPLGLAQSLIKLEKADAPPKKEEDVGTAEIYGPARVGGNNVVFSKS